jgi:biotin operon repressor
MTNLSETNLSDSVQLLANDGMMDSQPAKEAQMTNPSETDLTDSMQLTENDGMMDSPPTKETKMDILSHLSSTPTTLYALGKALGISQTALTMQLVAVGGKIEVKDGGLILAAPAVKPVKEVKPRGQMARVVGRLEIAREALLALVKVGPTTVGQVVAQVGDKAKYGDILWVARQEMDKGTIKEVKYGRTNVWTEVG